MLCPADEKDDNKTYSGYHSTPGREQRDELPGNGLEDCLQRSCRSGKFRIFKQPLRVLT